MKTDKIYVYGRHALKEALMNAPAVVKKVFLAKSAEDPEILELLAKNKITHSELTEDKKSTVEGNGSHQGVIATIDTSRLLVDYKEFINSIKVTKDTMLVLLGEVQDPHNVGAVIRSAAAFGAAGVLIPEHKQAPVTGAVVKVSAGMAFKIPLISIGNVNQTVEDLKKKGFYVYGLAGEGAKSLVEEKFEDPTVLILGNESTGIREKTREHCDHLLSIPIDPKCESLNAAVSASVALYAWSTRLR